MAFPIIPKKRSGATGNPSTLELGELATNTQTGELFLGGDGGVMLLNPPTAAGTTVTEHTGDGATVAFTFTGYSSTDDGAYLVSVGGIDQPPSKYSVSSTAGGTITFVEAPVAGELISIRAIVAGGGGGGSGNATQIQGRNVASDAPTNGQVLAWDAAQNRWEPTSLNGSVTFNSAGTHQWAVPAWVRWVYVNAAAGDGAQGIGTDGEPGQVGQDVIQYAPGLFVPALTGLNGADGISAVGDDGKSIEINALAFVCAGGAGGEAGVAGYGGGGSGGASFYYGQPAAPGAAGNGPNAGQGGAINGTGGAAGGNATAGSNAVAPFDGGAGGAGANGGGDGGAGGSLVGNIEDGQPGGGGGGGDMGSGGGGGAGGTRGLTDPGLVFAGTPGAGGLGTPGGPGEPGDTFTGAMDFSTVAGTTIDIVISEGAGNASITITW